MSEPENPSTTPVFDFKRLEAIEQKVDQLARETSTRLDNFREGFGRRLNQLDSRFDDLEEKKPAPGALTRVDSEPDAAQTLETHYLCHCGESAAMTFAFPGEAKQGRCAAHEAGIILRKEFEPGRTHVAQVERFDGQ